MFDGSLDDIPNEYRLTGGGEEPMKDGNILAVVVEPGKKPEIKEIDSSLEGLQALVGGYIQAVYPYEDPVGIVCNEEAKLEGLPLNRALRDEDGEIYDIVAGTFAIVGLTDDSFGSLDGELALKYAKLFEQPEQFAKPGDRIVAIPMISEQQQKQEVKEQKDFEVNMDTSGLAVSGHVGTWHTIDHMEVDGHTFFLMEHDSYGDEAACLIVDEHGKLSLSDVYDGFDEHTVDLLHQEVMIVDRMPDPSITTDLKAVEGLKKYISYFRFNLSLDNDMAILFYMAAELIRVFFLHEAYAVGRTFHLLKEKATAIHNVYRFIGFLDSILSVAILREELPYYCLPGDNRAGERLRTQAVYHPLIENCIPNDMVLHEKSALITGSNMAGKTCFMRTIGVNLLAAKTLHTCFAEVFEINTGISLLSSIHQGDNLMENKSYFMQEVTTIKDFVDESGHGNHLFLLDELFRGTNTKERIAISKAVLSWLVKSDNLVFVSTHDLELADMLEDEYELYYFSESVKDGILSFDYKLKRGVATEHNAIKILEICDYPASLVSEAHSITSI